MRSLHKTPTVAVIKPDVPFMAREAKNPQELTSGDVLLQELRFVPSTHLPPNVNKQRKTFSSTKAKIKSFRQ